MADPDREAHGRFYEEVYSQDAPSDGAHGWVQWKGTEVCMDLHCECGNHGHVDADFFYYYRCPACGACYAVGQVVKLIRLTPKQVRFAEGHIGLKSDMHVIDDEGD